MSADKDQILTRQLIKVGQMGAAFSVGAYALQAMSEEQRERLKNKGFVDIPPSDAGKKTFEELKLHERQAVEKWLNELAYVTGLRLKVVPGAYTFKVIDPTFKGGDDDNIKATSERWGNMTQAKHAS